MVRNFEDKDKGMTVKTRDGEEVGTIERVSGDMAEVKPSSNLSQSTRNRIGWTEENQDRYELRQSEVEEIGDQDVKLKD